MTGLMKTAALILALAVGTDAAPQDASADEITALPGWDGDLPSRQFSGYLDASPTKHLHYWFVESEGSPADDPILFWFNGGPGCSSLDGFLYEHGPFRVTLDAMSGEAALEQFDYSWSKLANTVYVEAPCGVGFSYSDVGGADYACTDDTAAADNLAAVEAFFAKFPAFSNHSLFLTGESYAGIYVPTLAEAIVQATLAGTYAGAPLAGIAVGNGCSGSEIGICGWSSQGEYYTTKFLMSSGFAPEGLKDELNAQCDWASFSQGGDVSAACDAAVDELSSNTQLLDTYCVYCDCPAESAAAKLGARHSKVRGPLGLGCWEEYRVLKMEGTAADARPSWDDALEFTATHEALLALGFTEQSRGELYSVYAAVLQLGNLVVIQVE